MPHRRASLSTPRDHVRGGLCGTGLVLLLLALGSPLAVRAQTITDNDFEVDAVDGPVLGSSREVGMGGAYTALASGAAGAPFNPAAFASRELYEYEPWAWDIAFSWFFPGVGGANDFFDNGRRGVDTSGFQFIDIGGRIQFKEGGVGVLVRTLNYHVPFDASTRFDVNLITAHGGLAYGLLDGQLTIGLGVRVADMSVALVHLDSRAAANDKLISFTGLGGEAGFILGLTSMPFRIGATVRMPVDSRVAPDDPSAGTTDVSGILLPRTVHLPWEVEAGIAWQLGPKPLNARFFRYKRVVPRVLGQLSGREGADAAAAEAQDEVEHEAYVRRRSLERRYVLLSASLLFIGSTSDGVGIDAFLEQQRRTRGRNISFSLRLGAEAEIVPDWVKLRAGFYIEPARQTGVAPRPHVTVGTDVRLFTLFGTTVRGTFTLDGAPRYADVGVGVGVWH